jgi:hypothetical protein
VGTGDEHHRQCISARIYTVRYDIHYRASPALSTLRAPLERLLYHHYYDVNDTHTRSTKQTKMRISHTEIHPALHERHSYPTFRLEGASPNSNPQSSIYSRAPFPDSCVYAIIYHRARDGRTNECTCKRLHRLVHRYRVRARVNSTHNARCKGARIR